MLSPYWIMTHCQIKFDLLYPTVEMVDIKDIAHALSHICRFTGHTDPFYSVAAHSLACSFYTASDDPIVMLQALMHDSAEAYIGDISSPMKAFIPEIRALEERIRSVIFDRYCIPFVLDPAVHAADREMLRTEAKLFSIAWESETVNASLCDDLTYFYKPPHKIERMFLERFDYLRGLING